MSCAWTFSLCIISNPLKIMCKKNPCALSTFSVFLIEQEHFTSEVSLSSFFKLVCIKKRKKKKKFVVLIGVVHSSMANQLRLSRSSIRSRLPHQLYPLLWDFLRVRRWLAAVLMLFVPICCCSDCAEYHPSEPMFFLFRQKVWHTRGSPTMSPLHRAPVGRCTARSWVLGEEARRDWDCDSTFLSSCKANTWEESWFLHFRTCEARSVSCLWRCCT